MDKRSQSASKLKRRWMPSSLPPATGQSRSKHPSRVSLVLTDSQSSLPRGRVNRSYQSEAAHPSQPSTRYSSVRKLLSNDPTSLSLAASLNCSPDDLFQSICEFPLASKEAVLKNRILEDVKRITHADLVLILHRKVFAEVLSQGTVLAQLNQSILDQLCRLPRLPDALSSVLFTLEHKATDPGAYQDVVLDAINKEIGLYQDSISDLSGKVDELRKEKKTLAVRIKELESHRQLDSALSRELSQIRTTSPTRRMRCSPSPEPPKNDIAGVYKRKLESFYALLEAANHRSTAPMSDLEAMNDLLAKAVAAESGFYFALRPLESCFFATYKGMSYRVNSKNSILSVALTNQEFFMLSDEETGFDGRLGQQMGIVIRTMIVAPVIAWGEPMGVLLLVNRKFESSTEKLLQAKTEIQSLLHIYTMVLSHVPPTQRHLESKFHRTSEVFQRVLDSCVTTLQETNLSEALQCLCTVVTDIMDAERAHILFCNSKSRELYYRRASANSSDKVFAFPSQKGISGYCAHTRQTLSFADLRNDKRFSKEIDDPDGENAVSAVCAPIFIGEELDAHDLPYAVIVVLNKRDKGEFAAGDVERMKGYGGLVSGMLQATQVRENFFALKGVLRSTVQAVADVVQSMDSSHKYNTLKHQLSRVEEVYTRLATSHSTSD